jgi:hypothetical protein
MRNGNWLWTRVLALVLPLVTAVAGGAQEPARREQKPPGGTKSMVPPIDAKAVAESRAAANAAAALLESVYQDTRPPEAVRMLVAILRGSQMGPGEGWFGPAQSRYSWKWLADRCGVAPGKGGIPRSQFRGPDALFARLDRNKDGGITPDDFDWSDRNPYIQVSYMTSRLFGKLDAQRDGRLTKAELLEFFEKAADGKDHVSADDFRDALLTGLFTRPPPSEPPSLAVLIRGVFSGELGSIHEGPKLNDPAPDFTLKKVDGKGTVQLSKLIGPKPVVLVFGSFT